MFKHFEVYLVVFSLVSWVHAAYYPRQAQQPYANQQPQPSQQQNLEAWRRYYYQQQQQQPRQPPPQQAAAYSPARGPQNYYSQSRQPQQYYPPPASQPQYSPRQPPAPSSYSQRQGYAPNLQPQYSSYQQQPPPGYYRPPAPPAATPPPPPPTSPAAPVEVEFEMEVPTTTTARPTPASNSQWGGQYSQQNYGQHGGQYQPAPSASHQQPHYQQPQYQQPQYQPAPSSGYYQPQQPQQPQPQPPKQQQQQQQYQNSWSQPPPNSPGVQPSPAADGSDPFATFDVNSLKPTVFNTDVQAQPSPANSNSGNEFAGLFGEQISPRPSPNAPPPGKVDFSARGPNPIQLNQFLAQPAAPKEVNALDSLLGSLLSGTVAVQSAQLVSLEPASRTTKPPPPPAAPALVSDRLNGFVLGPRTEYRSNTFSEIPVNSAAYDSLNPLAAFMGETPPPPITTTPPPPGRNGDFLEGFIGVSKAVQSRPVRDNFQPNIYVYNRVNEAPPPSTAAPLPVQMSQQASSPQDLGVLVQRLLGALAVNGQV